jgi:hypothetical protein
MLRKGVATLCMECGEEFRVMRAGQKFCSPGCRFKNWDKNHIRISRLEYEKIKRENSNREEKG